MAKVTVNGKEYGLRFDLYAMEQIEEEFGSVKDSFEALKGGKQIRTTRKLFKILANSFLSYGGQEETVTGNEILHAGMEEVMEISDAIRNAIAEGSKSETTGGNEADDSVHDIYLEAIEKQEKN